MRLRNSEGTPVDPVPFFVVVSMGFAALYTFAPMYLLALGLTPPSAVSVTTAAFLGTTGVAYHRYVWAARPERRKSTPGRLRLLRLYYASIIGIVVVGALALALALVVR